LSTVGISEKAGLPPQSREDVGDTEAEVVDVEAELIDVAAELVDVEAEILDVEAEIVDVEAELVDVDVGVAGFVGCARWSHGNDPRSTLIGVSGRS
jgi:hypothetical protein